MNSFELAKRYAKVLLQMPEHVFQEIDTYSEVLKQMSHMTFFYAPNFTLEDKINVIQTSFAEGLSADALNFIRLIIEKKRFSFFPAIIEICKELNVEYPHATIITAVSMEEQARSKWQAKVNQTFGKKVQLIEKVDRRLLGGVILMYGNQMLNASLRDRLQQLKKDLLLCT